MLRLSAFNPAIRIRIQEGSITEEELGELWIESIDSDLGIAIERNWPIIHRCQKVEDACVDAFLYWREKMVNHISRGGQIRSPEGYSQVIIKGFLNRYAKALRRICEKEMTGFDIPETIEQLDNDEKILNDVIEVASLMNEENCRHFEYFLRDITLEKIAEIENLSVATSQRKRKMCLKQFISLWKEIMQ